MPGGYGRGNRYRWIYRMTGLPRWARRWGPTSPYFSEVIYPPYLGPAFNPSMGRYPFSEEEELRMMEEELRMMEEDRNALDRDIEDLRKEIEKIKEGGE